MGFFPEFHRIKNFRGAIAPLHHGLLHQRSEHYTLIAFYFMIEFSDIAVFFHLRACHATTH